MAKKIAIIMAMALVLCGFAMSAQADVLTPGTLADWIALDSAGGTIGDKLFYDFELSSAVIQADDIAVTPLNDPFNPGILFTAAWTVANGQHLDSAITYKVQVLPGGNPIIDVSAEIQGFGVLGNGVVAVAEDTSVGDLLLTVFNGEITTSAEITFPATLGPIEVFKDISVTAPGDGDFATVSGVFNRFSEVPVPPAVWLFGSGMLGLVGLRFRRKRA